MDDIRVPRPACRSYFCAKAMITGKYCISGVMMFVVESPTR
jgi:hypothetical protein